ncbi:MAG: hypothetical protein M0P31_06975 [Solirubrobacteraceae bacterium]|nr:hypothetical protein [Solirubrobacteraceae bacterium]
MSADRRPGPARGSLRSAPTGRRGDRAPGRRSSERVVAREYRAVRDEVLRTVAGKLRAAGVILDESDLDAAYNQAWHALYVKLEAGEPVESRVAMLVTITHRRALDDHRSRHVDRRAELAPELPAPPEDLDARIDDRTRLRSLRDGMRERLSDRELEAATLCYLYDHTRAEAARRMGLTPRRMEKVMDGVSRRMGRLVEDVSGDWCRERRSMILAYALGVLDPDGERHALAASHLEDCSACRRRVLGLRGIASLAPPLPLLAGTGAVGVGAADGAPDTDGSAWTASGAGSSAAGAAAAGAAPTGAAAAGAATGTRVRATARATGGASAGAAAPRLGAVARRAGSGRRAALVTAGALVAVAVTVAIALATVGGDDGGTHDVVAPTAIAIGPDGAVPTVSDRPGALSAEAPDVDALAARGRRAARERAVARRAADLRRRRAAARRRASSDRTAARAAATSPATAPSVGAGSGAAPSTATTTAPPPTGPTATTPGGSAGAGATGTGSSGAASTGGGSTTGGSASATVVDDGAEEFDLR